MDQKSNSKINLNNISEEKLIKVLAISARLAKRIIAFRPITSISQLDQIWGLDSGTKQKIADFFDLDSEVVIPSAIQEGEIKEVEPAPIAIDHTDLQREEFKHQDQDTRSCT